MHTDNYTLFNVDRDTNGTAFIRQEGAILHFTGCGDGTTREILKVIAIMLNRIFIAILNS